MEGVVSRGLVVLSRTPGNRESPVNRCGPSSQPPVQHGDRAGRVAAEVDHLQRHPATEIVSPCLDGVVDGHRQLGRIRGCAVWRPAELVGHRAEGLPVVVVAVRGDRGAQLSVACRGDDLCQPVRLVRRVDQQCLSGRGAHPGGRRCCPSGPTETLVMVRAPRSRRVAAPPGSVWPLYVSRTSTTAERTDFRKAPPGRRHLPEVGATGSIGIDDGCAPEHGDGMTRMAPPEPTGRSRRPSRGAAGDPVGEAQPPTPRPSRICSAPSTSPTTAATARAAV